MEFMSKLFLPAQEKPCYPSAFEWESYSEKHLAGLTQLGGQNNPLGVLVGFGRGWRVEWPAAKLEMMEVGWFWPLPDELLRRLSWGEVRSGWWERDTSHGHELHDFSTELR